MRSDMDSTALFVPSGQIVLPGFSESLAYFNCANLNSLDAFKPEGAHIFGTGTADDGLHYHLKGSEHSYTEALNEFFQTSIARFAKLPTVAYRVIRHKGKYYFGSETLSGLSIATEIAKLLRGQYPAPGLSSALSKILSVDLVMGNPDRHYKNFLIQKNGEKRIVRVIDFSTGGLTSECWRHCIALSDESETVKQIIKVKQSIGIDKEAGREALTALGAMPDNYWEKFSDQIPLPWQNSASFEEFQLWWERGRAQSLELANKELDKYA